MGLRRGMLLHGRVALAIGALITLAACGGGSTSSASPGSSQPFIIGAAIAQTSFLAPFDGPSYQAAQFAVADINAKGGVNGRQLKLIVEDTKSDQAAGATVALDLINKGASLIMVSCDFDFGSAAALTAKAKGLIAFSACAGSTRFSTPDLGPLAYTDGNADILDATAEADWTLQTKGWKKVYLLEDTLIEYTKRLCTYFPQRFTQLGGTVVGKDTFANGDPSIASQISRIKALSTPPDFIELCSLTPGGASAVRQIRAAGITTPIVAGEGMEGDFWFSSVPNLSDFYVSAIASIYGDDPNPKINALTQRFITATGKKPQISIAYPGYSMIEAIALAAQRANSFDPRAMATAMDSYKDEPFLVGPTTYDQTNHWPLDRPMAIESVTNGVAKFVQYVEPVGQPTVLP